MLANTKDANLDQTGTHKPSVTMAATNELLSTQKPSDSGLEVVLHPLPLLEISDYITRAYQRGGSYPAHDNFQCAVVGALLGQQNGRQITIEHSFSCKNYKNEGGFYELDKDWFAERLQQSMLPPAVWNSGTSDANLSNSLPPQ